MRTIIFNADDFGLTAGVNAGIIGAHLRGPVRGATLMVTTPGFADAVALARAHPTFDLGIHLALTGVRPLLPPDRVPSLVGRDGRFPPLAAWLRRVAAGRLRAGELRAELTAQLERALATGLPFSHLDGHHHVHLFPPVARVVGDLARRYAIPVVRRIGPARADGPAVSGKRGLLTWADARSAGAYRGLRRTDAFRGFAFPIDHRRWRDLLRDLPAGVTEFMCHPGLSDATVRDLDPYVAEREIELRWLCDRGVAALLDEPGIAVTGFARWLGQAPPGVPHPPDAGAAQRAPTALPG